MTEAANTDTAVKRAPRQFGREYDYVAGTAVITSAYDKDFKGTVSLEALPDNVKAAFILQSAANYCVEAMNEVLNDDKFEGTEDERKAKALATFEEAKQELEKGELDFRTGVGLGGMRSAIGALGTVLFDLGKTFVMNAKGEKLSFSDVHGARAAVKALYQDTEPQGDKKVTSRMIFNVIQQSPEVKAALAKMAKKPKVKTPDVSTLLG
jgi:hypothetical protein